MEDWFRPKKYLHFDYPIQEHQKEEIEKLVSNPEWVAKHSFYPFISYETVKYKTREDAKTEKRFLDDSGTRQLSYAAHLDAQIYSYYSQNLSTIYEERLSNLGLGGTVIAFRKLKDIETGEAKSNIHLAKDAFDQIKSLGSCTAYAFDIKSFFDNLNPKVLKKTWKSLLNLPALSEDHFAIFRSISNHSVVDRTELYKAFGISRKSSLKDLHRICEPEAFRSVVRGASKAVDSVSGFVKRGLILTKNKGIPQGSPISAVLANIYMLEFDFKLDQKIREKGGFYFRYCDDILCLMPEGVEFDVVEHVEGLLKEIHLTLNSQKTDISIFKVVDGNLTSDKPIQYLGFMFDGKRTYLRTSSISRYLRKAKKAISLAQRTMKKYNEIRTKKGVPEHPLYRKKLFNKYFHTGKSNFITYGYRAAKVHDSPQIKNQMKKLCKFLMKSVEDF